MKKLLLPIITSVFLISSAFATNGSTSSNTSTFTPTQREEIGKIAADYIVNHPDVLVKASKKLQQQQMKAMQDKMLTNALANKQELLNDKNTPMTKPNNAKVAVIEFFDYQCAFCHKVFPTVKKLIKSNPNVMYVFKEFPIFSQRWKTSKYAAEIGQAVYQLGGYKAYIKYHNAVFSSGKMEGKLTKADIDGFVTTSGVDLTKAKALAPKLSSLVTKTLNFGIKKLNFQGTPIFIIMPINDANKNNTTVIPGFTNLQTLQNAINKAKGGGLLQKT